MQLHELALNKANEYSPALLIVTWEEESLDEATARVCGDVSCRRAHADCRLARSKGRTAELR